jgi:hypothetical protein
MSQKAMLRDGRHVQTEICVTGVTFSLGFGVPNATTSDAKREDSNSGYFRSSSAIEQKHSNPRARYQA